MTEQQIATPVAEPAPELVCPKCGCTEVSGHLGTAHGMDVWIVECDACEHVLDIDYA